MNGAATDPLAGAFGDMAAAFVAGAAIMWIVVAPAGFASASGSHRLASA